MAPFIQRATLAAASIAVTIHATHAFDVYFWGGPECTSTPEGSESVVADSSGECYSIPENAQAATVEMTGSDASYYNIAFYSSSDCSGTEEASTDGGCIDFTSLGANALSYAVSNDEDDPGRRRRQAREVRQSRTSQAVGGVVARAPQTWQEQAEDVRKALNVSIEQASGSVHPGWDPYAHVNAGFGHGNVTETWGKKWKWQQVALGMSIGIPVEDWDDNVHTMSERYIPYGDHDYEALLHTKRALSTMEISFDLEKRWDYDCEALIECSRTFLDSTALTLGTGWAQAVKAAYKLVTYGSTFNDFVHGHPFSVGIATAGASTLAGYGLGYTHGSGSSTSTAQDNTQFGQCSNDSTQVQSFIDALLASSVNVSTKNSAQITITLPDGNILALAGAVFPAGTDPEPGACDDNGSS